MISSPKTHPNRYNTVTILGYTYYTRKLYGTGAQEIVNDLREAKYLELHPDVTVPDPVEFQKWCDSKEGVRAYNRAFVSVAFIPGDGSPDALDLYEFIPRETMNAAMVFTTPLSEANTNTQPESSDSTADSTATASLTNQ